jgi:hypothetical protein
VNRDNDTAAVDDWLHRQAMFTLHHLKHLVRDIEQATSRKYRAAWGDHRLPELASAVEALQRLVELDEVDAEPKARTPPAWLDEWQQGFALHTGAFCLLHQLSILLRGLRSRRAVSTRKRLGAEYLLSLGVATKSLEDLYDATCDWQGPDESEPTDAN